MGTKTFLEIAKPRIKPKKQVKPKYDFRIAPTPIPKNHDPYENISRIMPIYVADNYTYFELLTFPKQKIKDWESYLQRIRQKIACLKAENLL